MGVLIDARDLFHAVRELAELGRHTNKLSRPKEGLLIDARPLFLDLKVGMAPAALTQQDTKD